MTNNIAIFIGNLDRKNLSNLLSILCIATKVCSIFYEPIEGEEKRSEKSSRRKDRESIKTTDVDQSQNQKEKSRRKREDTWDIPPEKSNQMIRQKTIDLDQDKLSSGGERHEQHKGTIQNYVIGLFGILTSL